MIRHMGIGTGIFLGIYVGDGITQVHTRVYNEYPVDDGKGKKSEEQSFIL